MSSIRWIDLAVIVVYMAAILAIVAAALAIPAARPPHRPRAGAEGR